MVNSSLINIHIPESNLQNSLQRAHFFSLLFSSTSVAQRGPFPFSKDGAQPLYSRPFCRKGNLQS